MITDRILQILKIKGVTKYKFCKDLGLSNGFLDKPREISTDKYANILDYFPDVSPKWLLTGEGKMLLDAEEQRLSKFLRSSKTDADAHSKALLWLMMSSYTKKNQSSFSFDSFPRLADIFDLASTYTMALQQSIETELMMDVAENTIKNPVVDDEGSIVIPESLTKSFDKYVKVYDKIEEVCLELLNLLNDPTAQKNIFDYLREKSKNTPERKQ